MDEVYEFIFQAEARTKSQLDSWQVGVPAGRFNGCLARFSCVATIVPFLRDEGTELYRILEGHTTVIAVQAMK